MDKRAFIRRTLRGIKLLSADIDKIARKKTDFDSGLGTLLSKILSAVYAVLKKYARLFHHEPFDIAEFWGKDKFTMNLVEWRRTEIALYLASIQQVCWDLEFNYIRTLGNVRYLDCFIMLSGRCIETLQNFFVKFNPRGLKETWKIPTYSDGSNIWML